MTTMLCRRDCEEEEEVYFRRRKTKRTRFSSPMTQNNSIRGTSVNRNPILRMAKNRASNRLSFRRTSMERTSMERTSMERTIKKRVLEQKTKETWKRQSSKQWSFYLAFSFLSALLSIGSSQFTGQIQRKSKSNRRHYTLQAKPWTKSLGHIFMFLIFFKSPQSRVKFDRVT